jgi:hypothetical protein
MPENRLKAAESTAVEEYRRFLRNVADFCVPSRNFDLSNGYIKIIEQSIQPLTEILRSYEKVNGIAVPTGDFHALFNIQGHEETESNERGELTGWLSMPLGKKGKERASVPLNGTEENNEGEATTPDYSSLVLCSDVPRTVEHALRRYYSSNADIMNSLDAALDNVRKDMKDTRNTAITKGTYSSLVDLALNNGIIPVPALRAQFFGPLELFIEKLGDSQNKERREKLNEEIRTEWKRNLAESGMSDSEIKIEMERLEALTLARGKMTTLRQEDGKLLFENYLMYFNRSAYAVFNTLTELKFRKVDIIGHSGFKNIVEAYFRHIGKEDKELHIVRSPTPMRRGQHFTIKTEEHYLWLNDPQKLDTVTVPSAKTAIEQRTTSLDEKIRVKGSGDAIIPVELLGFEKREDQGKIIYDQKTVSLDDDLRNPMPSLWLGNFGQGKSTAALWLHDKFASMKDYVPVFITAKDINRDAHNLMTRDNSPEQNDQILLNLISRGTVNLPSCLREEYKFLFIVDAFDEVTNYRNNILHVIRDSGFLSQYGKVILTSRFTGMDIHENPGFTTLHLDPQAVIRNMDKYLELRIKDEDKRARFKDFLMRQDNAINTNYLLVYFATDIYNKRPHELGDLKGTVTEGDLLIKGIEIALWDNKLTKDPNMPQEPRQYGGQTERDYRIELERYESIRRGHLDSWMGLLQRIAAYMTTHDMRSIRRAEIESLVENDWTLAKHIESMRAKR